MCDNDPFPPYFHNGEMRFEDKHGTIAVLRFFDTELEAINVSPDLPDVLETHVTVNDKPLVLPIARRGFCFASTRVAHFSALCAPEDMPNLVVVGAARIVGYHSFTSHIMLYSPATTRWMEFGMREDVENIASVDRDEFFTLVTKKGERLSYCKKCMMFGCQCPPIA